MTTPTPSRRIGPQDARHVPLTRAQRLAHDAAEAAEVRAYQTHPDVVALRVSGCARRWTGSVGPASAWGWRSP
jgi:hypothetical protein